LTSPSTVAARGSAAGWAGAVRDLVHFYRLRRFRDQVPALRPLVYTLFGSAFVAAPRPGPLAVNAVIVGLQFLFFGAFNNLWDGRLRGEENGTSLAVRRQGWSPVTVAALLVLPWAVLLPLVAVAGSLGLQVMSLGLLLAMVALGVAYVAPPIRLKDTVVAFWVAPAWAVLLFLEAALSLGQPAEPPMVVMACVVVAFLQVQAEIMHRVADGAESTEPSRMLHRLRRLPALTGAAALAMGALHPIVLLSVAWAAVRWVSLRRLTAREVARVRSQPWHPAWSLYELVLYAVVALARG
jgi:hypothetical protein